MPIAAHASTLLACLLAATSGACQEARSDTRPAAPRAPLDAIVDAGLKSQGAYEALERLVAVAPRRLAGSPGLDAALQWGLEEMRRAGLENVHLEPCEVPCWRRGDVERLVVLDPDGGEPFPLAVCALGGSVGTPPGGIEAEVIEVKGRAELETLGERARGKLLFFDEPMDPTLRDSFQAYGRAVWQRSVGAIEASRRGGVGAIVRSMTTRLDDLPHTGAMRYDPDVPRVPAVAVSTVGAARLADLLHAGKRVRVRMELDCAWHDDVPSANVVGELPGREIPDQIVLVGGHIDAWDTGDGANDDGAGCVQSIEAARLMACCGLRPRRTLRVVLFTNEENGLRGGLAYRDAHEGELERHVLALETDRGGFLPQGFATDAGPAGLAALRQAAAPLAELGVGTVRAGGGGADISPLASAGVPLAELLPDSSRYFDIHHCPRDTIAEVSPRELELGALSISALLWQVCERDQPLPRNPVAASSR